MLKKERQIYILEKVKREGRAITNDLVEELGVRIFRSCPRKVWSEGFTVVF